MKHQKWKHDDLIWCPQLIMDPFSKHNLTQTPSKESQHAVQSEMIYDHNNEENLTQESTETVKGKGNSHPWDWIDNGRLSLTHNSLWWNEDLKEWVRFGNYCTFVSAKWCKREPHCSHRPCSLLQKMPRCKFRDFEFKHRWNVQLDEIFHRWCPNQCHLDLLLKILRKFNVRGKVPFKNRSRETFRMDE